MAELAAAALKHDVGQYIKLVRHLPDVVKALAGMFGASAPAEAKGKLGQNFSFGPKTPLNIPITGERGFAAVSVPLDTLKQLAVRPRGQAQRCGDGAVQRCAAPLPGAVTAAFRRSR